MNQRPRSRQKNITGASGSVHKRGSGIGSSSPVGRKDGYAGRRIPASSSFGGSYQTSQQTGSSTTRAGLGGSKLILIVIAAVVLLGGGGLGSLLGLFTGGSSSGGIASGGSLSGGNALSGLSSMVSLFSGNSGISSLFGGAAETTPSSKWTKQANTGTLDRSVAAGARDKYTKPLGNGEDTVTLLVYMCGTDLESKNGMASADLQEMLNADLSKNINLLVYTGGCKQWRNDTVSSSVQQIYQIKNKRLYPLKDNCGTASMTSPATLTGFIDYGLNKFSASRCGLILWDHGGGSLSGYGYDEKDASSGSMTLKGLKDALKNYEKVFDFIGFDACLMGTLETGLALAPYADYLIASEETEPGIGWFYTTWLNDLSKNTSLPTVELGKSIVDSFVKDCNDRCRGQKATLSVVDLAELSATVPEKLRDFAADTCELLQSDGYQTVSDARSGTREFAASNKLDQIDLVDFAYHLNTEESNALAKTLLSAVKYNNTAAGMTNAYGISVYFPYRKTSQVNSAVATYDAIGMEDEYSEVIRQFAGMEAGGQAASTGSGSPLSSLLGGTSSSGLMGSDAISQLLSGLMGGGSVFGKSLDPEQMAQYLAENQFDASALEWEREGSDYVIRLSEEQWSLIHELAVNVFVDDGEGYIDLGIDNAFTLTEDGALLGDYDGTWLALDGNFVAYYYESTVEEGDSYSITGRIPVMLNGARAELILVFDNAHPYGFVAGARPVYADSVTQTVAKGITELSDGDKIDFLCDYYTYDGDFSDTYYLGEQYTWHGQPEITNLFIEDDIQVTYLFTDIYNNEFWTPPVP